MNESEHIDGDLLTRTIVVGGLATNCYVIASAMTRRAIVLDPGDEPARILDAAPSTTIQALHTPGHTPGGLTLVCGRHAFTGDTLFAGGPGLTGWPMSDFGTIMHSITTDLMALADDVVVHPGHGHSTTIGAERPHVPEWVDRGW